MFSRVEGRKCAVTAYKTDSLSLSLSLSLVIAYKVAIIPY
jgi:hypothetical protein